jgi:hypothetical protein
MINRHKKFAFFPSTMPDYKDIIGLAKMLARNIKECADKKSSLYGS